MLYRAGLAHPTELLPEFILAALMLENMPAITGAEAEVPDTP